jgi:dsRNA-specific ribonuclease
MRDKFKIKAKYNKGFNNTFTCFLIQDNNVIAIGHGTTKHEAKKDAAAKLL